MAILNDYLCITQHKFKVLLWIMSHFVITKHMTIRTESDEQFHYQSGMHSLL